MRTRSFCPVQESFSQALFTWKRFVSYETPSVEAASRKEAPAMVWKITRFSVALSRAIGLNIS
ncbi:MAG: hypothetical protein RLT05_36190, partial [Bauldia litoralis]